MKRTRDRRRNPRGEGGRLREQLLQATAELLDEVGDADKVSVRAIAQRAGVSPTALYIQFPDRDSLIEAAVDASFAAFNAMLLDAAAVEAEPRARLAAMGRAYLEFSERQPALYATLFSARRPLVEKKDDEADRAFDALVAGLHANDPALDDAAARELAVVLWSSLHGYALLRAARPRLDWPEPADYVRRLLRRATA